MGHSTERQVSAGLILAEAHPDEAYYICDKLREADTLELELSGSPHQTYGELLSNAIASSGQCWTILDKRRRVLGFWGHGRWPLDPADGEQGYVWLLSVDELFQRFPKELTRIAKDIIFPKLDAVYSEYGNVVSAVNHVHLQWLKRLGFKERAHHTVSGEPFIQLMRRE